MDPLQSGLDHSANARNPPQRRRRHPACNQCDRQDYGSLDSRGERCGQQQVLRPQHEAEVNQIDAIGIAAKAVERGRAPVGESKEQRQHGEAGRATAHNEHEA